MEDLTKEQLLKLLENKNGKLVYVSQFINTPLVSINSAYHFTKTGSRIIKVKNKKSKEFQKLTYDYIKNIVLDNNKHYKIFVEMHVNYQSSDVDNRFKLLLDIIENAANRAPWDYNESTPYVPNGFDDKQFLRVEGEKIKVKKADQGFQFFIYEHKQDERSLDFDFTKKEKKQTKTTKKPAKKETTKEQLKRKVDEKLKARGLL